MNSFYIEGSGETGMIARLQDEDAKHAALHQLITSALCMFHRDG